ncbi:MAG: tetratricopeptide repeat protein [Candidatus Alcyoniella australis]|nr:tetratricopeptide repeat protein [Candidatus Alcyoniella australis]
MRLQCPSCSTVFELSDAAIPDSPFKARCSKCGTIFTAQPSAPDPVRDELTAEFEREAATAPRPLSAAQPRKVQPEPRPSSDFPQPRETHRYQANGIPEEEFQHTLKTLKSRSRNQLVLLFTLIVVIISLAGLTVLGRQGLIHLPWGAPEIKQQITTTHVRHLQQIKNEGDLRQALELYKLGTPEAYQRAAELFAAAAKARPDDGAIEVWLAASLFWQNRLSTDQALVGRVCESSQRAQTAKTEAPVAARARLYCALASGETERSLELAQQLVALGEPLIEVDRDAWPQRAEERLSAALAYVAGGKSSEALDHLKRAVELDATNLQANFELAKLLAEGKDYAAAIERGEAALKTNPEHAGIKSAIEQWRAKLAQPTSEPDDDYEPGDAGNALARHDQFNMLMRQGREAMNAGRYTEALHYFASAKQIMPLSSDATTALGYAYLSLGNNSAALDRFNEALGNNPGHASAYRGLGICHQRMGSSGKAIYYYERYLQLAPGASDADQIRQRITELRAGG